jgi:hypothetical protein
VGLHISCIDAEMVIYCSYDHIPLVQLLEKNVIFLEQITRKNKETQSKVLLLITTSFSIQNHAGNTPFFFVI